MKKSIKKKINIVPIFTFVIIFLVIGSNTISLRKPKANCSNLDSLELQINELAELDYSPEEITRIVKMTNNYSNLYVKPYDNKIIVGNQLPNDDLTDVRIIELK